MLCTSWCTGTLGEATITESFSGGRTPSKTPVRHDLLTLFPLLLGSDDKSVPACGGTIESLEGRFASPLYPDSYPNGVECVWDIKGSPGNTVKLSFESFGLDATENCNGDYVEVHESGASGPLIGHFCGSEIPGNETVGNQLWVKFNSDAQGTGNGFVAYYTYGNCTRMLKNICFNGEAFFPANSARK